MRHLYICFILIFCYGCRITCLENGLARTPPMGWLAWERFKCNMKCDEDPSNCISENLFMEMADRLIADGYHDAGYEYVNIDDCWMSRKRDKDGNMVADPDRFPHGIPFLVDYMHSRGLKLGIYQDFGRFTCMGFPGIIDHMYQDAKKFIEWDVDMVKLDGCHANTNEYAEGYPLFGELLHKSGKPILYSCSWPYYELIQLLQPNYTKIATHCNMWRNFHDINENWKMIQGVIDFFGDNQETLTRFIGPGHWSDPDMILIGSERLTPGQSRIQMAVWSMIPGPLLMSNDLRDIRPEAREILLNKKVIAVNQDPLGLPGKRMFKRKRVQIWKRSIHPQFGPYSSYALLLLNVHHTKKAVITLSLSDYIVENGTGYHITELFEDKVVGEYAVNDTLKITVSPMDAVMLRLEILKKYIGHSDDR